LAAEKFPLATDATSSRVPSVT